jgi:hypothetical protein
MCSNMVYYIDMGAAYPSLNSIRIDEKVERDVDFLEFYWLDKNAAGSNNRIKHIWILNRKSYSLIQTCIKSYKILALFSIEFAVLLES